MMHLDDFDVVVRPEDRRDAPSQAEQHVDADAHIGGDHDRHAPGRLGQRLAMLDAQAGGADDQRGAVLLGVAGILEGGGGTGEVDDDVGHGEQLRRIVADANAGRRDAGERTQITADGEMAGCLETANQAGAGRLQHRLHQHPPHPPSAAGNSDPHDLFLPAPVFLLPSPYPPPRGEGCLLSFPAPFCPTSEGRGTG